ncbi:MAG TPA: hypothetical protein VIJ14_02880, partial [Rhabdochlamydiaceae bacterium]
MAASVGFFNPSISNTANVVLVGSILTTTCLLQLMVQKNFEAKANAQESDSLRQRTILILSGSTGLAGLLAGGDLKKSVALAAAALVILAVVDFASQHSEDKTPHDPKGKNPDSPTISPRETPPVTPVKGKSPKKTVPSTLAAIPASGSPEKVVRSMPPPPSKSSGSPLKTVPVGSGNGSAPLRKKWPDPTKPVPPRVAPPQGSPIHTMPSPRVITLPTTEKTEVAVPGRDNGALSGSTSETSVPVEARRSPTPPLVPDFNEDIGETELMVNRLQGILNDGFGDDWDVERAEEEGWYEEKAAVEFPKPFVE